MKKVMLLTDINSAHTKKWAIGLHLAGWQVCIFGFHAIEENWYSIYNITVRSFGLPVESAEGSALSKWKYLKATGPCKTFISEEKPDIVHAHYATSYGLLGKKVGKKPFVLSLWGSEVYDFPGRSVLHKYLFKRVMQFPDVVCSTSKDMAEECRKYVNRQIKIIPFGIDLDTFKLRNKRSHEQLIIGTVKALEHVYGIDRLIEAYAEFRKNTSLESKLVVYGSGSQLIELEERASQLGISQYVTFPGFVSGSKLIEAYESLDVFCALSRRESFGVAVIEAEAMSLPVIVSDAGGLSEVVIHEKTGFIIPEGELKGVVDSMVRLSDTAYREQLGENARKYVEENYNFEHNLKQQIDIYNAL